MPELDEVLGENRRLRKALADLVAEDPEEAPEDLEENPEEAPEDLEENLEEQEN